MTIQRVSSKPGCHWLEPCIEVCGADPVYVAENAAEAYFENHRGHLIRKIYYDDCYCRDQTVLKADFILGLPNRIDVVIELKGADLGHAYAQVESTLARWRNDPNRYSTIACLIIHSRREATLKRVGILPRWRSQVGSAEARFLRTNRTLLLIRESSIQRFRFDDFLRKNDVR